MNTEAEKSLAWLKSYWNHQRLDEITKAEIKLETRKELFNKKVDRLTIGEFYQWLLSEGYIFKTKDEK
ncbi:hypothetical protein JBO41_03240 [Enterobacter asburiae]|uniref:hypothetical protein n=1 Tax=Enterobacter cloacae complex TaxID=354276 RepID=UPI00192BC53D|nr:MULTISPECIES: hypothetical protein [Enterobacter cloacae complex]MBL5911035.1 hypothetical protein [Enterobacter asburiae]MBL5915668.1 hypothetical protein [Enterobacter asburiae]MDH1544268.1 hypothetical protein [Enterobacter ludwigii]